MFWIMKVLGQIPRDVADPFKSQSELVGQIPRDVADPFKSIKVNWWIQMMGIGFFRCMKRK